ncbi:MAG: hypothetical protein ACREUQ_13535 [Burkholderiales bacterium]
MLDMILQTIDKTLGSSLATAADIVFWSGLVLMSYLVLAALTRLLMELRAARIGLEKRWVMNCPTCERMTIVSSSVCEHCGRPLGMPLTLRVQHIFMFLSEPHWLRNVRWALTFAALVLFVAVSAVFAVRTSALAGQSNLERMFLGFAMIAWTGLAWLIARMLNPSQGGVLSRLRDAVFALVVFAILSVLLGVVGAARPVPETVVATVQIDGQVAQLQGQAIALAGSQMGFEYLQIDHPLVGFHRIIPIAIFGAQRVELPMGRFEAAVSEHLWEHSNDYTARGLSVRRRTEQLLVDEPGTYEVVLRGNEVKVRKFVAPQN